MSEPTVTAAMASQIDRRKEFAIRSLLHRLIRFARAYPAVMDDRMPEHDIVWVDDLDRSGPAATIVNAIKMHPELWVEALPAECCIVHRNELKRLVGAVMAEYLENHGVNAVSNQAAHQLYEMEQRETSRAYR